MDHQNQYDTGPENQSHSSSQQSVQTPIYTQPIMVETPRKRRSFWGTFSGIVRGLSILVHVFILLFFFGIIGLFASGFQKGLWTEKVIREGSHERKIVAIDLKGIIEDELASEFSQKIELLESDDTVCGVIVRIDSPGGTVSASDRIYQRIDRFKRQSQIPVVALQQGIAASGGYYASVACDHIMAEPTTITGSIGVILSYFVVEDLLQEKLGIEPVVLKAGERKDWPSMFASPTEPQKAYVQERQIQPAYERFVSVVIDGRSEVLSPEEVRKLADGSVYSARQAQERKLVDSTGYLQEAIDQVERMAGVTNALVVEYREIFSFMDMLRSSTQKRIAWNTNLIYELGMPRLMYLWR